MMGGGCGLVVVMWRIGARVLAVDFGLVAQLVGGPKNEICVKRTVLGIRFRLSVGFAFDSSFWPFKQFSSFLGPPSHLN